MMKTLLLSILFLNLGLSPSWAASCSYPDDPQLAAQKKQCEKSSSKKWDCSRNRCITTQASLDMRNEYFECAQIEDSGKRKECHDKIAQDETKSKKFGDGSTSPYLGYSATAINASHGLLMAITNALAASADGHTTCTSSYTAIFTSVAAAAAAAYIEFTAAKDLKELREEYEDSATKKNPYEAQRKAFEYLKKEQEMIAKYANMRKIAYFASAAGYAASGAIAVYEAFQTASCGAPGGPTSSFSGFLTSPEGVITISGVGATLSGSLAAVAMGEEKQAKENAKKVSKVMKKFEETMSGFCPNGRENLSNPRCYCYTDSNKRNPERTKSQTCKDLWAQDDKYLAVAATDYSLPKQGPAMGCLTVEKEFDPDCKCKKFKNEKGENACYKIKGYPSNIGTLNSALAMPQLAAGYNSMFNGNTALGTIGSNNLGFGQMALKNSKVRDQLEAKYNKELKQKGEKPLADDLKLVEAFQKKFLKPEDLQKANDSLALTSFSGARPQNSNLAQALKKAEEKAQIENTGLQYASTKKATIQKTKKKNAFNFALDEESTPQSTEVETFEGTSYDYKENDIVKREDASLWQIISKRYTTSGLRRLFDDEI